MNSQHGGPRPAIRPDDKRHSNPGGPGRKPKSFTLKLGDSFHTWAESAEGRQQGMGEMWTVSEITRSHVLLTSNTGARRKLIR